MIRSSSLALLALCACRTAAPGPEEGWRRQVRGTLFALPSLEAEAHETFEVEPEIVGERVTYRTQFGFRVPAIPYRPAGS